MARYFCSCGKEILWWGIVMCQNCSCEFDLLELKNHLNKYGEENPWVQWEIRQRGILIRADKK